MSEEDLLTPLFIEDESVSPQYTRWFPNWVWFGHSLEGEFIFCRWAIARWKVTTGARFVATERTGLAQIGGPVHEARRELRTMTPDNIRCSDIAANCCLVPKEEDIP